MSLSSLYNQLVDIYRPVTISNDFGGPEVEYRLLNANVPCRIRSASISERQIASQSGVVITHIMYCAASTDIVESDQVRSNDIIYDITAVETIYGSAAMHHKRVTLRERRPSRHGV